MSHLREWNEESATLLWYSCPKCRTWVQPRGSTRQNQTEGQATKFLACPLQKRQGHGGQGKTEELLQTEGDMPFESSNVTSLMRPALSTLFKIPNPPPPYSLCPAPCITFLHNTSQLLMSSLYCFPLYIASFTRTEAPWGKRLLSCLAHHCVPNA